MNITVLKDVTDKSNIQLESLLALQLTADTWNCLNVLTLYFAGQVVLFY